MLSGARTYTTTPISVEDLLPHCSDLRSQKHLSSPSRGLESSGRKQSIGMDTTALLDMWVLKSFMKRHHEVIQSKINSIMYQTASGNTDHTVTAVITTSEGTGLRQRDGKRAQSTDSRDRQSSENDDGSDEDGEHRRRPPKIPRTTANSVATEPRERFACPYYQHSPSFYQSKRSCPGPGWLSVSKVK
jgi:hypothetical protein